MTTLEVLGTYLIGIVRHHAHEAAEDEYQQRVLHVIAGLEFNASPPVGLYLQQVGTDTICREIGIPWQAWEYISDYWVGSFQHRYDSLHYKTGP